jgi:hypothetical protein
MNRNVGSTERYARLALGAAAGAAALRTSGWQRATLGAVAAAGLGTGLSRYCPINQAIGRHPQGDLSPLEAGRHDTELRRHASMHSALGTAPSTPSLPQRP